MAARDRHRQAEPPDRERTLDLLALAYGAALGAPRHREIVDWVLAGIRMHVEQRIPLEVALGIDAPTPGRANGAGRLRTELRDLQLVRAALALEPDGSISARANALEAAVEDFDAGVDTPAAFFIHASRRADPTSAPSSFSALREILVKSDFAGSAPGENHR